MSNPEPTNVKPIRPGVVGEGERRRRERRTFHQRFLEMFGRESPPEVVAASFALGVAISFTPLLGLHWVIALFIAVLLKLNKIDVLLGTLVVNPLTIGPISAVAIPIGRTLLRARRQAATRLPWHEFFSRQFWSSAGPRMRTVGIHWAVGMFVLAFLAGALTYVILLNLIRRHRAHLAAHAHRDRDDDVAPPSPS